MSGGAITTVDGKTSVHTALACQKTAKFLEILVQPSGTGDLATVHISRDTDLNGTFDQSLTLPMPVSGICANGIISCAPGTWNACSAYRWDVGGAALTLTQVDMPGLSGCYCINTSCGTNLAWSNMASLLGDLGGGVVGALTSADPRYGVSEASINGPVIDYVGAQATACTNSPALAQTGYARNATSLSSDASAAAAGNSIFQMVTASPAADGSALETRACSIERGMIVAGQTLDEIVQTGGAYTILRSSDASADYLIGSPADNSLEGGTCGLFDFRLALHVDDPAKIRVASFAEYYADDWAQVRIDGTLIASGPRPWTGTGLPPGACEQSRTYHAWPDIDLKPYLTAGDHSLWLRVGVGRLGEGYARLHLEANTTCTVSEQLVDHCTANAADSGCHLTSETVDGVDTVRDGVKTGLTPLPQTRIVGADRCTTSVTRDFFKRSRTYRCTASATAPDLARSAYILDHSTERLLADRTTARDGTVTTSSRRFAMPPQAAVSTCEAICKTRAPKANSAAAPAGVVGAQQNDPTGYDIFYHICDAQNQCPLGPSEALVTGCGCLNSFPEAAVMMQTVRLAGADISCTTAQPQ